MLWPREIGLDSGCTDRSMEQALWKRLRVNYVIKSIRDHQYNLEYHVKQVFRPLSTRYEVKGNSLDLFWFSSLYPRFVIYNAFAVHQMYQSLPAPMQSVRVANERNAFNRDITVPSCCYWMMKCLCKIPFS